MSQELKMLPIRQKQIVEKIKAAGFSPNDFEFNPYSNDWFDIHYNPNRIYFIKIFKSMHTFRPGQNGLMDVSGQTPNWEESLNRVNYWLKGLKENVDIGDPWKELQSIKDEINEMNWGTYEEIFNEEGKAQFHSKLDLLVEHFKSLKIETSEIKRDIDHLKEISDKLSKKDILLLFLGNITGWLLSGLVPVEVFSSISENIKTLFSAIKVKFL